MLVKNTFYFCYFFCTYLVIIDALINKTVKLNNPYFSQDFRQFVILRHPFMLCHAERTKN